MGSIHYTCFRRSMDDIIDKLNERLRDIDKCLEEKWNYEDYRQRSIIVHKIEVAKSRRRSDWDKGEFTEIKSISSRMYID